VESEKWKSTTDRWSVTQYWRKRNWVIEVLTSLTLVPGYLKFSPSQGAPSEANNTLVRYGWVFHCPNGVTSWRSSRFSLLLTHAEEINRQGR